MNKEYNMEEAFDKIEAALNALEVIVEYGKNFKKYNLCEDLDLIYIVKEDQVFKEFVKCGVNFVEQNLSQPNCETSDILDNQLLDDQITTPVPKEELDKADLGSEQPRVGKKKKKKKTGLKDF